MSRTAEPVVVDAADQVRRRRMSLSQFATVFAGATVWMRRPDEPGVFVADVPGKGRWVLVFSTPERLGRYAGDCEFFSTSGADLLGLLPADVGVLLDPQDTHVVPVLPKAARAAMPAR